jgi:hypothetical protein
VAPLITVVIMYAASSSNRRLTLKSTPVSFRTPPAQVVYRLVRQLALPPK